MQEDVDYFISAIEEHLYHLTTADGAVFVVERNAEGWRWRYYDDPALRKVSVGGFASQEQCLAGLFAYLGADGAP